MVIIGDYEAAKKHLSRGVTPTFCIPPSYLQGLRDRFEIDDLESTIAELINNVRRTGDTAIHQYNLIFENVETKYLEMSKQDIDQAFKEIDGTILSALKTTLQTVTTRLQVQQIAIENLKNSLSKQLLFVPFGKVGVCLPAFANRNLSQIMMTITLAKLAGVKEINIALPLGANNMIPNTSVAASILAGGHRVFLMSGAQAVAAFAFGTQTVPKVDKIIGSGNVFSLVAKKMLHGFANIEDLTSRGELIIIADDSSNHQEVIGAITDTARLYPDDYIFLLTTDKPLAEKACSTINGLITDPIINVSLRNCHLFLVNSIKEAVELTQLYAPGRVLLAVRNSDDHMVTLSNVNSIIIGIGSIESVEYLASPLQVLSSGGTARFNSTLSILTFLKTIELFNYNTTPIESDLELSLSLVAQTETNITR